MNSDEAILSQHRDHLERINAELARSVDSAVPLVGETAAHTLLGGGKRLRPLLFVLSCDLCGYHVSDPYRLAVIFEIIHAASLLHDDVLDNAEVRRSKPSANALWGNHAAVLVGDFLYSKSFSIAVETGHARFLKRLTETTTRMAEGQVLELQHANDWGMDEASYLEVVTAKTAVLISAACSAGAILSGGGQAEEALSQFGLNMGVAFQLMDDILDYTASAKVLGKPAAKDLREGKMTLPLISTLAEMADDERRALESVFKNSERPPAEGDYNRLVERVRSGGSLRRVKAEALGYVERAAECLMVFPDCAARRRLLELNRYIVARSY